MPPEIGKLLLDMLEAARSIATFVRGKSFEDFCGDDQLRSSIFFKFIVIGEALSQLRLRNPELVEGIAESQRIVGLRNQVVHGYGKLDDAISWRVIEQKIPVLISDVGKLLAA